MATNSTRLLTAASAAVALLSSAASAQTLPREMAGMWDVEGPTSCTATSGRNSPWEMVVTEPTIMRSQNGFIESGPASIRRLGDTRWYVDVQMAMSGVVSLDINMLAPDRLLVAERPLGEARFFVRCREGRT